MGRFKFSDAPIDAGGDAFFDAKKLGLHQVVRQCRAVDRDEGILGARAVEVQRFGDEFLARAAFALNQDIHRTWSNLVDQTDDRLYAVAHADDLLGGKPVAQSVC